jgi:hypothetical protein
MLPAVLGRSSAAGAIVSANKTGDHNPPQLQPPFPLFEICISSNEKLANFLLKLERAAKTNRVSLKVRLLLKPLR